MGTVTTRTLTDGTLRYRAEIRINRKDYPVYKESKTFSNRRMAESWLKKREVDIEANPSILYVSQHEKDMKLTDAIDLYLSEVGDVYSKSKINTLKFVKRFPISVKSIMKMNSIDLSDYVVLRKMYYPKLGVGPVSPSTIQHELLQIRGVLVHASVMWNIPLDLNVFDRTTAQLRKTRQISASVVRERIPTNKELKQLICYFYDKWSSRIYTRYPMHLIIMFAIFSCRRQAEITRVELKDYDCDLQVWKIKDVKNPNGSKGNNKEFIVSESCHSIINILLRPEVRKRFKSKTESKFLIPLSSTTISTEFFNACKTLGIEDLRFHDLRHEGCTRLAEQGLTIPQIQHYSLHDSWQSLQRYVSLKKRKPPLMLEDMLSLINET